MPNLKKWIRLKVFICTTLRTLFVSVYPNRLYFFVCVSTEAKSPALHTVKQVQGRLTPCWVHLPFQDYMLWQFRTSLLTCQPHTHTSWCLSASSRSTVVSCMTSWTTEKGLCLSFGGGGVVLKVHADFWAGRCTGGIHIISISLGSFRSQFYDNIIIKLRCLDLGCPHFFI